MKQKAKYTPKFWDPRKQALPILTFIYPVPPISVLEVESALRVTGCLAVGHFHMPLGKCRCVIDRAKVIGLRGKHLPCIGKLNHVISC